MLHYFHIIHFDIKPENIGYCKLLKKAVFLDFGLSSVVKEGIGYKA